MSSPLESSLTRSSFRNLCCASALRLTTSILARVVFIRALLRIYRETPKSAHEHRNITKRVRIEKSETEIRPFDTESTAEYTVEHFEYVFLSVEIKLLWFEKGKRRDSTELAFVDRENQESESAITVMHSLNWAGAGANECVCRYIYMYSCVYVCILYVSECV